MRRRLSSEYCSHHIPELLGLRTPSYFLIFLQRDIRPTIAVTKAHIDLPECREAIASGRLKADGKILLPSGQSICSKAAIEPVWYLPEIARRFETTESNLRRSIFRMTNGMYPELITRPDIKIFLPPIGGKFIIRNCPNNVSHQWKISP
jgi:hypothetical protein